MHRPDSSMGTIKDNCIWLLTFISLNRKGRNNISPPPQAAHNMIMFSTEAHQDHKRYSALPKQKFLFEVADTNNYMTLFVLPCLTKFPKGVLSPQYGVFYPTVSRQSRGATRRKKNWKQHSCCSNSGCGQMKAAGTQRFKLNSLYRFSKGKTLDDSRVFSTWSLVEFRCKQFNVTFSTSVPGTIPPQ